jgi:thioredoxin-like negative regulator of GroEL
MSELEDKLNSLLNNPAEINKIAQMAKSLFDTGQDEKDKDKGGETLLQSLSSLGEGLNPKIIGELGKIMSDRGGSESKRAILEAMKPYLNEKRRKKMEQAIQIAKLARLAEIVFAESAEDQNGV